MESSNQKISRKELFSGSMVIFIALFYLLSLGAGFYYAAETTFQWTDFKLLFLALFYLLAGSLFLLRKNAGWIMTTGILLNFVLVLLALVFENSQVAVFTSYSAMAILLFFLLLLALIFLFSRQTRKKYAVNNRSYLGMIAVYLLLIFINYFDDNFM